MAPQIARIGDGVSSAVVRNSLARRPSLYCYIRMHCIDSSVNRSCERSPSAHAASRHARFKKTNERQQIRRVHQARRQILDEANEVAANTLVSRFPCPRSAYLPCGQRSVTSLAAEPLLLRPFETASTMRPSPTATVRRSIMRPGARFKRSYRLRIPFNGRRLPRYDWVTGWSFDSLSTTHRGRGGVETADRARPVTEPVVTRPETTAIMSRGTHKRSLQIGRLPARCDLNAVHKPTFPPFADDPIERAPLHCPSARLMRASGT